MYIENETGSMRALQEHLFRNVGFRPKYINTYGGSVLAFGGMISGGVLISRSPSPAPDEWFQ